MLKNKTAKIITGVVLFIILILAGYFFLARQPAPKTPAEQSQPLDIGPESLDPEEIALELTATPDKKKIQFTIGKLSGIKSVSYELTYEADSTDQEISEGGDERIQRGITGEAKLKMGDAKYKSPLLDLGSCSKNVCRYDKGVNSVNLILKIVKDNDKVYQVEKDLEL